jgi:hypothetical protein
VTGYNTELACCNLSNHQPPPPTTPSAAHPLHDGERNVAAKVGHADADLDERPMHSLKRLHVVLHRRSESLDQPDEVVEAVELGIVEARRAHKVEREQEAGHCPASMHVTRG